MISSKGVTSNHSSKGIFVYGGCVSRDSFTELGPAVHLTGYVARQSLISAFNPPARILPVGRLSSNFQNRMLLGDIKSDLVSKLDESLADTDAIVVDLLVERLGVSRLRGGSFVTMSSELKQSKALDAANGQTRSIKFGTDEHFDLWVGAAMNFSKFLDARGMKSRTLVLNTPWAEHTDLGVALPGNASMSAVEANAKYERYYAALSEEIGFRTYRLPDNHVISSQAHRWGPAPYHYIQPAYQGIIEELHNVLNTNDRGKQ